MKKAQKALKYKKQYTVIEWPVSHVSHTDQIMNICSIFNISQQRFHL